jgi:FG-GAP-like repeat
MPIVTADFNNDGKVDVAVILSYTNQIAVYLGNGDGTLQSPILTTVNLPSGCEFGPAGSAAADFNADGNIDLVAWTDSGEYPSGTTELVVLEGNGGGSFNTSPYSVLAGPSIMPGYQAYVGDFDSDGKADIAATTEVENSEGGIASTTLHVLYGNNDFTFDATTPYTAQGLLIMGAGDLNSDGYTDIFAGVNLFTGQQLGVFYGNSSRTFDSDFTDISSSYPFGAASDGWNWGSEFTMADYNGDGLMDLAAIAFSSDYQTAYVDFFLAGANPGEFTTQLVALSQTDKWESDPVSGLFSGSYLTPDLTLNQSPNGGSPPQNTPSYLVAELNLADSGWFGPCYYPKIGEGFDVCVPGTATGSSALFSTAVNSFGELRKVELWVDGVKVQEQHHTWGQHAYFDWTGTFSAGTHDATFYAADIDNRLQRYDFTFTIGGST